MLAKNASTGGGGGALLATRNNNGLASPAIAGNTNLTSTNITLKGIVVGANYYLTRCACNGIPKSYWTTAQHQSMFA